jgi:hypothetical protein
MGASTCTIAALAVAVVATAPANWPYYTTAQHATHCACRNLLACQFGGGNPKPPAPVDSPLWSTGQAVFQHYKDSLPPIDPDYADKSKLRVSSEKAYAAEQATLHAGVGGLCMSFLLDWFPCFAGNSSSCSSTIAVRCILLSCWRAVCASST